MQLADALTASGLHVFPCWTRYNNDKQRYDKGPSVPKGVSWQDHQATPDEWNGITVAGVTMPPNVVVIDADEYKAEYSADGTDQLLGAVPWDLALIQNTISGGKHYAFKAPADWEVAQGSNIGGSGIDTRVAGKGFICTGQGYDPVGMGVIRLAYPDSLPVLPDSCREALERKQAEPTDRPDREYGDTDTQVICEALATISPDISHDEWIRYGMALRHQFADDPDTGFRVFDDWSCGHLADTDCPHSYIAEEVEGQYWKLKPSRGDGSDITVGTIFHRAIECGWVPPPSLDTALAFGAGAAPVEAFSEMVARIHESGTDVRQTTVLVDGILAMQCNALQRDLLTVTLKAALKSAGLLDKALGTKIDTMLRPDGLMLPTPLAAPVAPLTDITELRSAPLGRPSGLHGINALSMIRETFSDRVTSHLGGLRWWSGREWQSVPDSTLEQLTYTALMPDQCKAPNVAGTRSALKALAPQLGDCPRDRRIYFKNCVVDAATGTAQAHDAGNHNTGSLSVDWTPGADAPQWLAFINTIFGGSADGTDRTLLLQEIMGWALLQDNLNVQKIVAFDGASRAGKGVILEVLQAMLGPEKSGNFTFSDIDNGKTQGVFRTYDVVVDMEAKPPARPNMKAAIGFMNKVASNETVSIQLLNTQQPWAGRLDCKMILSCNGIPALLDDSGATTNRFLVLYFTRSFAGHEDRALLSRLLPEIPAIAAWAVAGAQRLIQTGGVFTMPGSSAEMLADLRSANQPLAEFIDGYLDFDQPNDRCTAVEIWQAYRLYCGEANINLGTKNAFGRSLKRALLGYPCSYVKSMRSLDGVSSGYAGFKIRSLIQGAPGNAGAFQPTIVPGGT